MANIDKMSYSLPEVATYLGIPESSINVRYTKDANNVSKALHKHWTSISEPRRGISLSSVKGYYISDGNGGETCVYAEYADPQGVAYSYVQHPGKPVAAQIQEDTVSIQAPTQSNSRQGGIDGELTCLSYTSLKILENALTKFIKDVTQQCEVMENGIAYSQTCMKDQSSTDILSKATAVTLEIKSALNPTAFLLQKVSELLTLLRQRTAE